MAKAKRKTIIWHQESEDEEACLAYRDEDHDVDGKLADDATMEQLAEFCDDEMENANYHDFVGFHQWLGKLLSKHFDREGATKVIRYIAERGGLLKMAYEAEWDDID